MISILNVSNSFQKTSNQSTAEEMSLKILHFDDIPVHYSIPLLFVFVMLVFSLCIFKDKIKCQRKRHCQTKTGELAQVCNYQFSSVLIILIQFCTIFRKPKFVTLNVAISILINSNR